MNNIKYLIWSCLWIISMTSCKKMDSTYKEYVVPSGIVYPGKVVEANFKSGLNEAQLNWNRGSDPKVTKARVYWNYYKDSIDVPMPIDQSNVSCTIKDLEENFYTFIIKTLDDDGHISVPVEVSGGVLGERFKSSLSNRTAAPKVNIDNSVSITFTPVNSTSDLVKSEIEYTSVNDQVKTVTIDSNVNSILIDDYKLGSTYKMRTYFMPETAFESIVSSDETYTITKLNKQEWKIAGYSSFYNTDTPAKMIDGNPATRWGTLSPHVYPHFFTVDFGVQRTLSSFSLWRQTPSNEEGPNEVQFLGSDDNINFVDLGNYPFNRQSSAEQIYQLAEPKTFRYLKVRQINGPKAYVVMGEFDVTAKF
ncbi:DUF4998 domain-containing protein [Sphingobacterium humi]|uniref:F5/8 type C domain-containing protein n=1 Tax=Sphingobacterium humi TaxID=1796905 RepID=A0A6N8L273_9SPHI|nr:DUF4998 domain-containing protein [Sphingobacterium humi]MVZ63835.1 hypothetical protein [Sphingobacterium humi]